MSIATFSLPVDIPWKRIAFTQEMMDKQACDRELPLRWRSSVAVFDYQPPDDQQRKDGYLVSYLKVSCTITGFQADGKEIRIRERLGRSGWTNKNLTDSLGDTAAKYYPCNGAMLEVVVAPHGDDDRFTLAEYPYFADFDPKKRELYEVVTETGETMSRSLEDVNVRLGQTTLQSHEVVDKTTLGASLSASYMGITGSGSVSNESGTTDLSQQGTENIRTVDGLREGRETFSHTTQLSQMYHQLDSYHLGTNRAAFFVLPRPHSVQSPATFVNGPREIEGIQEFMLVVVRPKEMEEYCVEAYLETAHLTGKPILDWGDTDRQLHFRVDTPDHIRKYNTLTVPTMAEAGYIIDTAKGPQGWPIAPTGPEPHGDTGGYLINKLDKDPDVNTSVDYTFNVGKQQITLTGWAEGFFSRGNDYRHGAFLEIWATVYLKKTQPIITGYEPGLMITGRAVCSCRKSLLIRKEDYGPSIVYEKALGSAVTQQKKEHRSMSIGEANQLGALIKRELLQSVSSVDRYPRDTVKLLDTQLFSEVMGAHIRYADSSVNTPLREWSGIDEVLAEKVSAHAPKITRAELLEMPLAYQVEAFGLSFEEAVTLRRSLIDIASPEGPPPVRHRPMADVPDVVGLQLEEAHFKFKSAGLFVGKVETVDDPRRQGVILEQDPLSGSLVYAETEVNLQISSGLSVRLPDVANRPLSEAMCMLRDAGLLSEPLVKGSLEQEIIVKAMEPAARTWVTPRGTVTLYLSRQR